MSKQESKFDQFLSGYIGKELLKKHSLTEYGTWKIRAADTNCDLSGPHYMADLGTVEGLLEDVIRYAVEMPGFWSWSSGDINLVTIKPVPKISVLTKAREEFEAAEAVYKKTKARYEALVGKV
jgi:hypothetical protein